MTLGGGGVGCGGAWWHVGSDWGVGFVRWCRGKPDLQDGVKKRGGRKIFRRGGRRILLVHGEGGGGGREKE